MCEFVTEKFCAPETVLVLRDNPPVRSSFGTTATPTQLRAQAFSTRRRQDIKGRFWEEKETCKNVPATETAAAMAQLRYVQESPSRRAVFKDLWALQGRRPSPVELDRKYQQITANKTYALQNRQQAASLRGSRGRLENDSIAERRKRQQQRSKSALGPGEEPAVPPEVLVQRAQEDLRQAQMNARAEVDKKNRETTAVVPTTVSDQMQVFTYLSDDSDEEEFSEADMRALQYWQRRYEDQQLVRKAFARSKAHKREAVGVLLSNLPRGSVGGPSLPGQYVPFKLDKFT